MHKKARSAMQVSQVYSAHLNPTLQWTWACHSARLCRVRGWNGLWKTRR